ncbi:putative trans-sialidase [Trypanosoma theileri]|uniref:Putative trans-sialidase n=1 Tax=Trypanosoma theileri TaxID=67003 RepID=A0A1X0NG99_9TRYP|nr:putative trans-sialidase [Trypanosoma theileri]ORC83735.1 putative trans-sialidase [Trypanosoma theileri]
MPHSLFVVLLLFLLGCISGYAQEEGPQEETVAIVDSTRSELCKPMTIRPQTSGENVQLEAVHQFYAPHLFFFNGSLVSITAAAVCQEQGSNQNEFIKILKNKNEEGKKQWTESIGYVFHYSKASESVKKVFDNDKNDYQAALALVESKEDSSGTADGPQNFTIRILWMKRGKTKSAVHSMVYDRQSNSSFLSRQDSTLVRFLAKTSTSILTTENNVSVFPVQFVTKNNKIRSTVMYYRPYDTKWNVGGLTDEGTYNPTVMEWENDKLMMITQHTSGRYRVYESTDLGKNWKESTSTLSRMWANSTVTADIPTSERVSQNNFITATIDNKSVILFTQSVVSGEEEQLYLWVTDNTRIYYVGLIVKDKKVKSSTLLFRDNKLYCLYDTVEGTDKYKVFFVDLTNKVKKIKEVLNKWDTIASKGICCTDKTCASSDCRIPTTGLVGYLSGTIDEERIWKDEYLCVDASVSGTARKNPNGFTFMGIGAGAMWPVSTDGLPRQYHFTNYAFTLVATVAIHAAPKKGSSPVLGVRLMDKNGQELPFGLLYNNDKTWSTINRGTKSKSTRTWELNNKYSVILTFENGESSLYINGNRLDVGTDLRIEANEEISHFYFGGYSRENEEVKVNVHISVTNVMLYNRVLLSAEIDELVKNKANVLLSESEIKGNSEQGTATTADTGNKNSGEEDNTKNTEAAVSQDNATSTQAATTAVRPETGTETAPQRENATSVNNTHQTQGEALINKNVKARQNKTVDGTVRIYESVLPMLLLGLWALATVLP